MSDRATFAEREDEPELPSKPKSTPAYIRSLIVQIRTLEAEVEGLRTQLGLDSRAGR